MVYLGVGKSGIPPGLEPGDRWFKSNHLDYGRGFGSNPNWSVAGLTRLVGSKVFWWHAPLFRLLGISEVPNATNVERQVRLLWKALTAMDPWLCTWAGA